MIEEVLDIKMTDGEMETFVCRPDRGGPFPAIFMLMDAPVFAKSFTKWPGASHRSAIM